MYPEAANEDNRNVNKGEDKFIEKEREKKRDGGETVEWQIAKHMQEEIIYQEKLCLFIQNPIRFRGAALESLKCQLF